MILTNYIIKREQKKGLAIFVAGLTLLIPYLIHVFDHGNIEQAQSLCVFKMLTGLPCPGCGITKSLIFFYQGDLTKSLHYHLFGPLLVLGCIFLIGLLITELLTKRDYLRGWFYDRRLAYGLAIILGGYHLIRLAIFLSTHSLSAILKDSIWQ